MKITTLEIAIYDDRDFFIYDLDAADSGDTKGHMPHVPGASICKAALVQDIKRALEARCERTESGKAGVMNWKIPLRENENPMARCPFYLVINNSGGRLMVRDHRDEPESAFSVETGTQVWRTEWEKAEIVGVTVHFADGSQAALGNVVNNEKMAEPKEGGPNEKLGL